MKLLVFTFFLVLSLMYHPYALLPQSHGVLLSAEQQNIIDEITSDNKNQNRQFSISHPKPISKDADSKSCLDEFSLDTILKFLDCTMSVAFLAVEHVFLPQVNAVGESWYNASWQYRRQITIDETKVMGSSDLLNFPVLISISDTYLKSANIQSAGQDIRFPSSYGATLLSYEIESFSNDSTTGSLVAWVKVPVLDYNDNTVLYMYYGNSGASSAANAANVFDSNYQPTKYAR